MFPKTLPPTDVSRMNIDATCHRCSGVARCKRARRKLRAGRIRLQEQRSLFRWPTPALLFSRLVFSGTDGSLSTKPRKWLECVFTSIWRGFWALLPGSCKSTNVLQATGGFSTMGAGSQGVTGFTSSVRVSIDSPVRHRGCESFGSARRYESAMGLGGRRNDICLMETYGCGHRSTLSGGESKRCPGRKRCSL